MHDPAQLCRCCGRVHQCFCGDSKGSAPTCLPSTVNHSKTPTLKALLCRAPPTSIAWNNHLALIVQTILLLGPLCHSIAPANHLIPFLQAPPLKAKLQFYPWLCCSQPIKSQQPMYLPFPPFTKGPNLESPGWALGSPPGTMEVLLQTWGSICFSVCIKFSKTRTWASEELSFHPS